MPQLVRLEGKHTTQNAHCAVHFKNCETITLKEYERANAPLSNFSEQVMILKLRTFNVET